MTDEIGGVVLWAAILFCLAVAPATAATGGAAPGDPLHAGVETDEIAIEVSTRADGNATWRIEYRTELGADGNTTDAFESLAADVRENPDNYTDRFADRIRSTVRSAENATGRSMTASDFSVRAETSPIYGIVTYTFEWSNFANVTEDRVVVGDAIGGFVMNADTKLRFQWPSTLTAGTVSPAADATFDRAVRWDGASTEFGPDQPRVVLEPAPATATPTGTPTATTTGTSGTTDATPTDPGDTTTTTAAAPASGGGGPPILVLGLLALAVAGVGLAWWRRSSDPGDGAPPTPATDAPGDGPPDDGPRDDGPPGDAPGPAASDTGSDASEELDEELLSNEERVLRVLEDEGGRAKQQEVVEALGWTEAKTSQVVSGMRDEGTIDGFRLGRENVLTLPEEEVDPTEPENDGGT